MIVTAKEVNAGALWLAMNARDIVGQSGRHVQEIPFERARELAKGVLEAARIMRPLIADDDPEC